MALLTDDQLAKQNEEQKWKDLTEHEQKVVLSKLVHIMNVQPLALQSVLMIIGAGKKFGLLDNYKVAEHYEINSRY